MREIERRRMRGDVYEVFTAPTGKKLARNFWGQAWQRYLESYADYESRLPRGRSYLKQGHVYNLAISPGLVTAEVTGQSIYEVAVRIRPLEQATWRAIQSACSGRVASLLDLLSGKLSDEVMQAITNQEDGLFPASREIHVQCNCPDHADLCKHGAAVLYAIGLMFDKQPATFFELRGVNPAELMQQAADTLNSPETGDVTILPDSDLQALFGIELEDPPNPASHHQ